MLNKKIIAIFILQSFYCFSQNSIKDSIQLKEVVITITKIKDSLKNLPFSISSINYLKFQTTANQFHLSEYIEKIPGVFISNDNNFAQDARISIRGFGSRANFGIRGIKLIVDGVPETTPDGQTQLDNLNLEIIEKIELIRGVSSSFYGNSSAGVIKIKSISDFNNNFSKIGYSLGSNNQSKKQAIIGYKSNNTFYTFLLSESKSDGYREYSGFKNTNFNLRIKKKNSDDSQLGLNFNYVNSPYAYDSGGLTIEEVTQNRRQVRRRNLVYKTEESIVHYKLSADFKKQFSKRTSFSSYVFFSKRDFIGKIPVNNGGIINLDRKYWGIGASILLNNNIKTQIGFDIGNQSDLRKRYNNNEGLIGEQVLDQYENFSNLGIYIINNYALKHLTFSSGFRYDINKVNLKDLFLADGNSSDKINLNSFNPSFGINYKIASRSRFFANISTGFETPTLNEFSSSPIGSGFNNTLKSQKSLNFEFGLSLYNSFNKVNIDVVYFNSSTKNEVLSYEDENFPNQIFYNNAGKSKRSGFEISSLIRINKSINIETSYSVGKYIFDDFIDKGNNYSGNKIPGVPNKILTLGLEYITKSELFINLNLKSIGNIYADNSNSVKISKSKTINFKIGKELKFNKIKINPFLTINNVFGNNYFDNIRINAFGGRHYEPAPKRIIFGGVKIIL